jgi:tagatose 6-phosphate kinase
LSPPIIEARNAVGSGDSTAGGFAAGRLRGMSLLEDAKLAVACGTASAKHGFGRSTKEEIEQIRDEIRVVKL